MCLHRHKILKCEIVELWLIRTSEIFGVVLTDRLQARQVLRMLPLSGVWTCISDMKGQDHRVRQGWILKKGQGLKRMAPDSIVKCLGSCSLFTKSQQSLPNFAHSLSKGTCHY